ncbi:hypothetical protein BHE74_00026679 [Ensete ventricosum]|nr:hypothetical protein BHE74_00026679 [Ensete ventricosum]
MAHKSIGFPLSSEAPFEAHKLRKGKTVQLTSPERAKRYGYAHRLRRTIPHEPMGLPYPHSPFWSSQALKWQNCAGHLPLEAPFEAHELRKGKIVQIGAIRRAFGSHKKGGAPISYAKLTEVREIANSKDLVLMQGLVHGQWSVRGHPKAQSELDAVEHQKFLFDMEMIPSAFAGAEQGISCSVRRSSPKGLMVFKTSSGKYLKSKVAPTRQISRRDKS